MARISIMGLASGLPPNIVDQLMAAERIPLQKMQTDKSKQENRLKLVTDLETKINAITGSIGELASVHGFSDMKLTSGDPNVLQGTVDPNKAADGSWNIQVEQLAEKAAAITNGFPDKNKTQVGVGYFRFQTPKGEKEVYIDGKHSTLQGVADAINAASVGVRATVINDRKNPEAPYKLMISGTAVGGDNQVKYPTLYFLDGDQDLYFDKTRPAKNGKVKVDGFEFETPGNTVKDIIPGVTLDLRQASPGRTVNISVKEDRQAVSGKIKKFVDAMNSVLSFIQAQNALTKDTDTSSTLGGDFILSEVEDRLRNFVQDPQYGTGSKINRIEQLGIMFNRNGTLDFNEKTFKDTLARDPDSVQKFLAGDGWKTGFIPALKNNVQVLLDQAYGPIEVRKRALQDRISQMDDQIDEKKRQLTQKEQTLREKFARLEETMSRLKGQQGSVAALGGGGMMGTGLKVG